MYNTNSAQAVLTTCSGSTGARPQAKGAAGTVQLWMSVGVGPELLH